MTGVSSSRFSLRNSCSTSMPLLRGIITSSKMTSNGACVVHRQCLLAIDRARDIGIAETPQTTAQHFPIVGIVVDDEQSGGQ